jgi:hypothetical protein
MHAELRALHAPCAWLPEKEPLLLKRIATLPPLTGRVQKSAPDEEVNTLVSPLPSGTGSIPFPQLIGRHSHMIRRKLLIANAIIASVAITGCSDTTAPKELAAGGGVGQASEGAHGTNLFYTTAGFGAEIFTIKVSDGRITTARIGPTNGGNCLSLALSPSGTLYSMCGPLFGTQRLATINRKTGRANLFGVPVPGLAVMAMGFARNGTLYAVGDCNPDANFECTPGSDPNYNSLFRVNKATGAFTRVGPTGAAQFFMDLALDREGRLLGVTSTVNPSAIPAILYRINPATGRATKITNLVGSNLVMGLAFGRTGQLFATDFAQNPGLYLIDIETGFETAIAALPFGFSSALELANP